MGSLRFGGVRFSVYSQDHRPAHVHAFYGEQEVILDLPHEGGVVLAGRSDKRIKANELRRILHIARLHELEIRTLWRQTHGRLIDR